VARAASKRAQILLAADAGVGDEAIATSVSVGEFTVYRTKCHRVEATLSVIWPKKRVQVPRAN
jgi:hypothetical protein